MKFSSNKRTGFALLISVLTVYSCGTADRTPCTQTTVSVEAPQSEVTSLKQYLDAQKIKATADKRGFFYTIQSAGSGAKPTACSTVTVNYTGKLTNGTTFDSGNDVTFGLDQLILGWQEGIPLIAPGGRITLYLPPSLAYGAQDQGDIPANSILVFTIDLLAVL
ncbi:FKBP-type peptidylprolyl isomerase [Spirosoma taeanense]|uniref:Peptidyl-prolyl cis-trans isomerase n=1 Tax=Spirosoma taeanense TaxID=2735870 RepID=A0A6M5YB90_9BACT|nr:FKBP-type peptidyl-prolyl cis-trans isomerase [Spirosoma taeanense]QJW90804.1 FKBP-type peptidylprolyl isomerase [Spirosoma taeanense]